jgi:glyoxylase-like metal-dependent hydrolase (beta-lactamase superfamily II)
MITRQIGGATVTRIEEIHGPGFEPNLLLPDWTGEVLKEHGHWLMPNYYDQTQNKFISSIHSWLIQTKHHTILVDTCCGNFKSRPEMPRFHNLNTPYLERLRAEGVGPEDVDYVLCTHLHVDHVGWNTQLKDGRWVPTFPNAKYVFSKVDRDYWDPDKNPKLPEWSKATFQDSVHPIIAARQEHLVEMTDQLGDALLIEPAPGHTPGQVVFRLLDGGEEAMFPGDTLHHPIQVYNTSWSTRVCTDPQQAVVSRERVLGHCAERGCRLLPAHFGAPHLGWVRAKSGKFSFEFDWG